MHCTFRMETSQATRPSILLLYIHQHEFITNTPSVILLLTKSYNIFYLTPFFTFTSQYIYICIYVCIYITSVSLPSCVSLLNFTWVIINLESYS